MAHGDQTKYREEQQRPAEHLAKPAAAPPGQSPPEVGQQTQAVVDALTQLGDQADPKRVAQVVKVQAGIDLDPGEVAAILRTLRERAATPPPLDQPPPENAQRRPDQQTAF